MSEIAGFPDDNNLWLVKWIDKIQLPHLSTTSASVSVLLQKLPISDPKLIHTLKDKQLQEILSPPVDQEYEVIRLLVGVLPEIEVGAVFQSMRKVANLPNASLNITVPLAELSCESRRLSDLVEAPYKKWDPKMPYRVLNKFEYHLDYREWKDSNFLIFKTPSMEYVIPRFAIFKAFYAQNVKFARAFTNGDWPTQCGNLVYMKELESGLKTGVDELTGEWNIVLQLNVQPELAPLLGIYIFDEYGKKCASSIYASMLKARNNNENKCWFSDAKIPFPTTPDKPLELFLQGFVLRKYKYSDDGAPVRFLVTKIIGSSLPNLPQINRSYVINGQKGKDKIEVDKPAPFSNRPRTKTLNDQTKIDSNTDSNDMFGGTEITSSSFFWKGMPTILQMQKESSKSYNKPERSGVYDDKNKNQVSPGNDTSSTSAQPEAKIKTLIRQPEKRFEHLLYALDSLKKDLKIVGYSIVGPLNKVQGIEIGGVWCWNFLDEDSRSTGKWPMKGWRMKMDSERSEDGWLKLGQPRSALVLRIDYSESEFGYWIEIEQKSTSYRSPYITEFSGYSHELIEHLIEIIARNSARNLVSNLLEGVEEFALNPTPVVNLYTHGYVKESPGVLSSASVLTFLKKCHKKNS